MIDLDRYEIKVTVKAEKTLKHLNENIAIWREVEEITDVLFAHIIQKDTGYIQTLECDPNWSDQEFYKHLLYTLQEMEEDE